MENDIVSPHKIKIIVRVLSPHPPLCLLVEKARTPCYRRETWETCYPHSLVFTAGAQQNIRL